MKTSLVAAAMFAATLAQPGLARASVYFDGIETADAGAAAPLGTTATGNPNGGYGGGLIAGDILFTAPVAGAIIVTLTDLGTTAGTAPRAGSVYEAVLDGTSLGLTAPTAIDAKSFSSGSFGAVVGAGDHVLGVWDFIATYYGFDSPYGGAVDADFLQADVRVRVTGATGAVPEPDSVALLGAALVGVLAVAGRPGARRASTRNNRCA